MNIRPWQRRDRVTADRLNDPVGAINQNLPVIGGTGILTTVGVGGTVVSARKQLQILQRQFAVVFITGQLSGGGKYTCTPLGNATAAMDLTTNLSQNDFSGSAGFTGSGAAVAVNPMESGKSTHDLTGGSNMYWFATKVNVTNENPARDVYLLLGAIKFEDCS